MARGRLVRLAATAAAAVALLCFGGVDALAYSSDVDGREAPTVDSFGPSGDAVPVGSPIVVTFNQPMAERSVVLTVDPSVRGSVNWLDDYTLQFKAANLSHGMSYAVSVHGRAVNGALVRGDETWRFTTASGPPLVIGPGRPTIRVPILMYHYIRVNPNPWDGLGFALSVTPANFAAQMGWLAASGYHPVTMRDLMNYTAGSSGLPDHPVVITFDDGYADFYSAALPVLRGYDFTAVAYVVSGFIGRPGYLTAAQILEAQDAGIEIGSHTVDHVNLTSQSAARMQYQVISSKQALEALLGRPVVSFCYPYGKFGAREEAAVSAAGYGNATTTMGGSWHRFGDRFQWTRVRVSGGEDLAAFAYAVQSF
jgi:peptidoglycan/xylan/chitin deacetylase (PgdA/CDA1 family)